MADLVLDSIAVDCPDSAALARFYGELFAVEVVDDAIRLRNGALEVWFQQVEGFLPTTWPTQERGQQVHLDIAARDRAAAIARAEKLGATRAEFQPDESHVLVMKDPAGHTFCMCEPWEELGPSLPEADDVPMLTNITVDCPDAHALAMFYHQLTGYDVPDFGTCGGIRGEPAGLILFQPVEDYAAPTWPTQERGQQMHFDFHTSDRDAHVQRAIDLGATLKGREKGFTVLLDPAGHPFCICDEAD